jgi:hypothetical protein
MSLLQPQIEINHVLRKNTKILGASFTMIREITARYCYSLYRKEAPWSIGHVWYGSRRIRLLPAKHYSVTVHESSFSPLSPLPLRAVRNTGIGKNTEME